MALGNNLKRAKKDNLIPEKKAGKKSNTSVKSSSKGKTEKKEVLVSTANLDEKILFGGTNDSTMTAQLIPSRRKTVRKTKLVFKGSLSLAESSAIKDCLMTTFNDYDLIDIQLTEITHIDLIPLQLIRTFMTHYPDKKITVDSELPFDIKLIVERAGFGSLMFKKEAI